MRRLGKSDHPGEGGLLWDRFLCHDHDALDAADVTPRARRFYQRVLAAHLALYGKRRFLARYPANGLRIEYLHAVYPEAFFVHLVRDGRAVTQSVLRMREKDATLDAWWGARPRTWRALEKLPPLEAVSRQWVDVVTAIRASGATLPPDRYMELRYEDLAASPVDELHRFCDFCHLRWDAAIGEALAEGMQSRNYKWREAFTPADVSTMENIMGPLLRELGYEV